MDIKLPILFSRNLRLEENGAALLMLVSVSQKVTLPNCPQVVHIPNSHSGRISIYKGVLENSRTVLSNMVATSCM